MKRIMAWIRSWFRMPDIDDVDPLSDKTICSFCEKSSEEVETLIEKHPLYICDRCVFKAMHIVLDRQFKRKEVDPYTEDKE